jgi:hypothetical protein
VNFLEKKAMNKAVKHIEPYLERGEALMDFDIGRVPAGQVALLATNMALYICPLPLRGQPMISPYVGMAGAERHGRSLYLQAHGGAQLVVDLGAGTRGLSDIVIHQVEQARQLRIAEQERLERATTATCRGEFLPLLLTEQDEGGPGVFRVTDGQPVFETDHGVRHSYGWDCYRHYERTEDGVLIRLKPFSGAFIDLETEEVDRWVGILTAAGVPEKQSTT